jgi:predicted branched-subunit amino acid permease
MFSRLSRLVTSNKSHILNTSNSSALHVEKQAFRDGFRASAGTMAGIFAWGLVAGMAMIKSGLTIWQALGMTFLVFAGSAQLAALPLIAVDTPIWVVFLTALVVNLRFVIFAAAVGPHFSHLPWHKRLWYGYLNADVTMAFFPRRFLSQPPHQPEGKIGFYTGVSYPNWFAWQAGSLAGIFLASRIPESWGVGFAGTLALLAIMIPSIINTPALAGVVVAGATAVIAAELPYRLGLLLGVVLGMVAAMTFDTVLDSKKRGRNA